MTRFRIVAETEPVFLPLGIMYGLFGVSHAGPWYSNKSEAASSYLDHHCLWHAFWLFNKISIKVPQILMNPDPG